MATNPAAVRAQVFATDSFGNVTGLLGPGGGDAGFAISNILPYSDQTFSNDEFTLGASGIVGRQRGYLVAVELLAGTGVTLTLQDNPAAASGRQVWAMPSTSSPRKFEFYKPLPFHVGCYATIAGTGPSVKFYMAGSE